MWGWKQWELLWQVNSLQILEFAKIFFLSSVLSSTVKPIQNRIVQTCYLNLTAKICCLITMTMERAFAIKTCPPSVIKIFTCAGSTFLFYRDDYSFIVRKGDLLC